MFGGLQGRHSQIPSIPDVEIVHPYKMFEEIEEIVIYFKVSVVGPRSVYLFACVCVDCGQVLSLLSKWETV